MTRAIRALILGSLTVLLALSGLVVTAPDSSAQAEPEPIASGMDIKVPTGSACPDGTSFVGSVIAPKPTFLLDGSYCRPDGFVPVTDEMTCDAIGGLALWVDQGSLPGVCAHNGWSISAPTACPAPTVLAEGADRFGFFSYWCLFELLIEGSAGEVSFGQPICIEAALVAERAPLGAVGTTFSAGGQDYLIHTGPPTCEVNCHGGFDFNCDDQLGDFCPPGLDLTTVVGIHDCLDGFALAEAEAEAESSVPAITSAPDLPQIIPVATSSGDALAHTGSQTTVLASLGFGLIGLGAAAVGQRRRHDALGQDD